jgi:hypothetical protein
LAASNPRSGFDSPPRNFPVQPHVCHNGTSRRSHPLRSREGAGMPAKPKQRLNKIDEEISESFPASDPPSFVNGIIGAPPGRKTKHSKKKPTKKKVVRKAAKKKRK